MSFQEPPLVSLLKIVGIVIQAMPPHVACSGHDMGGSQHTRCFTLYILEGFRHIVCLGKDCILVHQSLLVFL